MILVLAIILICIAHVMRMLRWELFVKTYEKPNTKNLLQSLSIGYFINSFIPFKAGDLVRAWISGRKMKNGRGFALATVIVDRYLDILVVGILFTIFSAFNLDSADSVWFYMFLAVGVLAVTLLVYILRGYVKRILKNIAGIFNAGIEIRLLRFFWSLIWSFKDIFKKISKTRLLLETLGMDFVSCILLLLCCISKPSGIKCKLAGCILHVIYKEQYSCWKPGGNNVYTGNDERADDMDGHLFICSDCDLICHFFVLEV